jgi:hypothetical protein
MKVDFMSSAHIFTAVLRRLVTFLGHIIFCIYTDTIAVWKVHGLVALRRRYAEGSDEFHAKLYWEGNVVVALSSYL